MPMDKGDVVCEWSQPEELDDPGENQMQRECSHGTLQRESSISFGRFESDNLAWEKWSAFSQNRYMEEVEKFSTPGSVVQKKAYFEAHFKKIAAQKALELQAQLEQQTQLESQSGIGSSNLNKDHHQEEPIELPDHNGEENKEQTFAHSIDFDNSPHQSDTEEGNLNTIHPNKDMSVSQTGEPSNHLHPLINNIEQEEVSGEDIASSNNIILENEKEHFMLDKDIEVDTSNMMEVDPMITCDEPEHQHSPKATEAENKGIEEVEVNEVAADHSLLDSQTQKQKGKLVPKDIATSNGKKAQVPHNRASTSRSLANSKTRTSKVSSGSNNAARSLPKVSGKPDNGVATRKKVADGITTTRKTTVIAEKGASTRQVLGDKKQPSKALPNGLTKVITSKKETSSNGAPKTDGIRTSNKEHNTNHNLTTTKKQIEKKVTDPKKGGEADKSITAGSHKSSAAKGFVNKASGTVFSFKSDERAEKRKEFYMKLEEKMNAKEAEMHEIQAKTQEERDAEIKQLRRSLNFKATPMPTFYQETTSIKVESKKIPPISAKSQKLGRKSTNSASDSDSSSVPTHNVGTEQEVNNNTSLSKKNKETQLDINVSSNGQKEVGSSNISNVEPSKSKLPSITSPRKEATAESYSAKEISDGLKENVLENPSVNEERNEMGVHVSTDEASAMTSSSQVNGRQENPMIGVKAKSEMKDDEAESKMITKSEVKVEGHQNTNNSKEKIATQKVQGVKDKDSTMSSGSMSKIRPSTTHEPKDKASKTVKHERQKIVMPVEKAKRQSTSSAPVKRGIKGNAGLACLIPDVAVS